MDLEPSVLRTGRARIHTLGVERWRSKQSLKSLHGHTVRQVIKIAAKQATAAARYKVVLLTNGRAVTVQGELGTGRGFRGRACSRTGGHAQKCYTQKQRTNRCSIFEKFMQHNGSDSTARSVTGPPCGFRACTIRSVKGRKVLISQLKVKDKQISSI